MEFLGRIFGRHTPTEEEPQVPSAELIALIQKWEEQAAARNMDPKTADATGELLQALANNPELMRFDYLKFVRDRNRVVMSLAWKSHKDIARNAGFQYVSDAGFVKRDSEKPNSLIVYERSTSLGVSPNKKNRPETVKVLSKIAPKIKIEAEMDHGYYR